MKNQFGLLLIALIMVAANPSFAKARPMPKPAHKCPKGQHWDGSMNMCMPN